MSKTYVIYKLSPTEDDTLWAYYAKELDKGLIRASKLAYESAVFFVEKKDDSLYLVTNYRELNEVIIRNR